MGHTSFLFLWVWVYVCARPCVWKLDANMSCLPQSLSIIFETGSSLNWRRADLSSLRGLWVAEVLLSLSLSAWITHVHAMPDEYTVLEIKVLLLHQDPHCWSCPPASSFSVSFDEHCLFSFFSLGIMWADFLGSFAITWRRVDITQTFPLYWITMIIELLKTTFYLQHFPSY